MNRILHFYGLIAGMLLPSLIAAQPRVPNDAVVMTVGVEPVYLSEFEAIFKKNNQKGPVTKQALDEYMELFSVFKLKVREAKDAGMDTSKAFNLELGSYVRQLSGPYLRDTAAEGQLLRSTYQRMQTDREIGHLLIRVDRCASPEDTLKAFRAIAKIRQDLVAGKLTFAAAVQQFSQDSLTKPNQGYLGWVTSPGMGLSYELEVYQTPVNGISSVVRTSLGYHLIRVQKERPARGRIKIAHIFVQADMQDPEKKKVSYNRIMEARSQLAAGKPWTEVVRTYSENPNSAARGGELPAFGINTYAPTFEDAAFGLKKVDEVSMPIETPEGFHLIRLIEAPGIPSYATLKPDLVRSLSKTSRWAVPKQVLVNRLKQQYAFSQNEAVLQTILQAMGDQPYKPDMLKPFAEQWAIKFAGKTLNWSAVADFMATLPLDKPVTRCNFRTHGLDAFVEKELLAHKEASLPDEDVAFFYLVREYREGILLFALMDQKVWKRSVRDTAGLEDFHQANREKYRWGPRKRAFIIDCKDAKVEAEARKLAPKLLSGDMSREKFIATLNKKVADNVIVLQGLYGEGEQPLVASVTTPKGISPTGQEGGKIRFAVVTESLPPTPKTLKECKGVVTSDYGTYLEQEWIKSLRAKYPIQISRDALYRLVRP